MDRKVRGVISFLVIMLTTFPLLAESKYRIGVSLPLTGEASGYGEDVHNALSFANKQFGQGKIKLIFEDDQCTAKGGLAAANKFASVDQVDAVLGPVCSGVLLAAAPVYQSKKILAFGIATSAPAISQLGDYIFRLSPNDKVTSALLAQHILKKREAGIGIFSEQTEYCEAFRSEFSQHIKEAGVDLQEALFNPGDSDFRASLLKLKSQGVKKIFINTQSEKTFILVVKQIAQMGWQPKMYAAYWPSSATVISELGERADGIEFVDLPSPSEMLSKEGESIYAKYLAVHGQPKSNPSFPPFAIEAFRIAIQAVGEKDPVNFLYRNEFEGILGKLRFDRNGDLIDPPLVIRMIKDGKVHAKDY